MFASSHMRMVGGVSRSRRIKVANEGDVLFAHGAHTTLRESCASPSSRGHFSTKHQNNGTQDPPFRKKSGTTHDQHQRQHQHQQRRRRKRTLAVAGADTFWSADRNPSGRTMSAQDVVLFCWTGAGGCCCCCCDAADTSSLDACAPAAVEEVEDVGKAGMSPPTPAPPMPPPPAGDALLEPSAAPW